MRLTLTHKYDLVVGNYAVHTTPAALFEAPRLTATPPQESNPGADLALVEAS